MLKLDDFPKNTIRTYSGLYMNVFEPKPEMFSIEDIAHALAFQCRFAGHLPRFYSVAQHSVFCMNMALEDKLGALMHDGTEAYISDMPSPIKAKMPEYKAIEDNLMKAVADKFGFKYPLSQEVKLVDREALYFEWDNLVAVNNPEFVCWSPEEAKQKFLHAYYELKEQERIALV